MPRTSHASRSRRRALGLLGSTVVAALAGCLARNAGSGPDARSTTARPSTETRPGDTTPKTQFQYDARHTGASGTEVPGRVEQRWRTGLSPVDGGLAAAAGRVLATAGNSIVALDAADGAELWATAVGHTAAAAPAVTADTAYVTAWNGGESVPRGVLALDLADGSERWRAIPDVDVSSAPTLAAETVYVGGSLRSTHVIAIDATDGTERWRFRAGQHAPTPAVSGGVAYVGGGMTPAVSAVIAADGAERWRVEVDGPVWGAPTISDETVYVGTRRGKAYALDAADGDTQWTVELGGDVRESLAVTGDTVYVATEGALHALSTDGDRLWSVETAGDPSAPTVASGSLVVADRSDAVCLDAETGAERWRHAVPDRTIDDMVFTGIRCDPVVRDGAVYVASHGGDVYALHGRDR